MNFCRNPDRIFWTPAWLLHRSVDKPSLALPPCPSPQPLRAPVFVLPASCLLRTALWGCAAWTERFLLPFGYPPVFSYPLLFISPTAPSEGASVRVFLIARNFFCSVWAGDRFFFLPPSPELSLFSFINFVFRFFLSPSSFSVDFTFFPLQFYHLSSPPLSPSVPLPPPFCSFKTIQRCLRITSTPSFSRARDSALIQGEWGCVFAADHGLPVSGWPQAGLRCPSGGSANPLLLLPVGVRGPPRLGCGPDLGRFLTSSSSACCPSHFQLLQQLP